VKVTDAGLGVSVHSYPPHPNPSDAKMAFVVRSTPCLKASFAGAKVQSKSSTKAAVPMKAKYVPARAPYCHAKRIASPVQVVACRWWRAGGDIASVGGSVCAE
jgi:hypothetical protein